MPQWHSIIHSLSSQSLDKSNLIFTLNAIAVEKKKQIWMYQPKHIFLPRITNIYHDRFSELIISALDHGLGASLGQLVVDVMLLGQTLYCHIASLNPGVSIDG